MTERSPLRVAVLGDSVVWGQGLARDDTYAMKAAARIAATEGRQLEVVQFSARSGAKIRAEPGEAELFVERYPALASRVEDVEDAASGLFGEVPCTFPTVEHQLDTLIRTAPEVDLLIMGGGANDMDFKDVIIPERKDVVRPPTFVEVLDPKFEEHVHAPMLDLLRRARTSYPTAQIMVPGYYPALSPRTDRSALRRLFRHAARDQAGTVFGWVGYNFLRFGHLVLPTASTRMLIDQGTARTAYAYTRSLYWLRRAVTDINEQIPTTLDQPRPPVLFVHPAFRDENAIFADNSFVHQEYELDELEDDKAQQRIDRCPRSRQLEMMLELRTRLLSSHQTAPVIGEAGARLSAALIDELDGPASLLAALEPLTNPLSTSRRALGLLDEEIDRVNACRLASFFHPNALGAQQYADRLVQRWEEATRVDVPVDPGVILTDTTARGERPALSSVGDSSAQTPLGGGQLDTGTHSDEMQLMPVPARLNTWDELDVIDSIAVRVRTHRDSAPRLSDVIELDLGTGTRWVLDHYPHEPRDNAETFDPRHFVPGTSDLFTIDPLDGLQHSDIRYVELHRVTGDVRTSAARAPWRPTRIELELNGVSVLRHDLRNTELLRERRLVLPYPLTEPVSVPDVTGMTHAEAIETLEDDGLVGGGGGSEFSDDIPRGRIISHRPSAGDQVMRGSRVALRSSNGPLPIENDPRTVPDVVGRRQEEAFAALRQVGFTPTPPVVADSDRPFGVVIGQTPSAGTRVQLGAEVQLVVSRGSAGGGPPGDGPPGRGDVHIP